MLPDQVAAEMTPGWDENGALGAEFPEVPENRARGKAGVEEEEVRFRTLESASRRRVSRRLI